jgi:GTP:adenosylcobinamide-phosphate guanylyltransferase
MALKTDNLFKTMLGAAEEAFAGSWQDIKSYTVPELQKIASTIVSIEANVVAKNYTQEVADLILRMQLRATQSVIVATTGLVLLHVENALNKILSAIADVVNTAIGFPLIAGI